MSVGRVHASAGTFRRAVAGQNVALAPSRDFRTYGASGQESSSARELNVQHLPEQVLLGGKLVWAAAPHLLDNGAARRIERPHGGDAPVPGQIQFEADRLAEFPRQPRI
jgi:hypothetical protein